MTPATSVTEQQHRTSITITEPGGQTLTLPVATETSLVNPVTGERALVVEQHRYSYYCQELARHITGASQEVSLNTTNGSTKCADILFPYDAAKHEWLARFLASSVITPGGDEPILNDGSLVAIEVEISDPAASSVNNATKDLSAGVDHVLIAIQPADRDSVKTALQQHVPSDLWRRIGITAILTLLDTIRPQKGTP
jgi:hypothetical protein